MEESGVKKRMARDGGAALGVRIGSESPGSDGASPYQPIVLVLVVILDSFEPEADPSGSSHFGAVKVAF